MCVYQAGAGPRAGCSLFRSGSMIIQRCHFPISGDGKKPKQSLLTLVHNFGRLHLGFDSDLSGFFAVFKCFGLEIQCKNGNFQSACQARHLWRWAGSSGPLGDVGRFFVCQGVGRCFVYSVLAVTGDSLHETHGIFCWHHECAYCVAAEARTTMVAFWVLHWLSSSTAMKLGHMIRHMKWQVLCLVTFFNMFTSDAFLLLKGFPESGPQKLQGCSIFCLRGHGWFFQAKAWHVVCVALGVKATLA